eukprot:m.297821 g.297821  ORF g.297821 m.297821 type:complete len:557 (+) comp13717_c0_seq1:13-1683(+)
MRLFFGATAAAVHRRLPLQLQLQQVAALHSTGRRLQREKYASPLDASVLRDRKTSIVCTIGPATSNEIAMGRLLTAGMNIMRLNFSHGDHASMAEIIALQRRLVAERQENYRRNPHLKLADFDDGSADDICAIAADTKGPEIRTGRFGGDAFGGTVTLIEGQLIELSVDPADQNAGNTDKIFVDYPRLGEELAPGQRIFVDDGFFAFEVVSTSASGVLCRVINGGELGERKGINIPGVILSLPAVTERDKLDLRFCVEQGVDMVFASFVRRADHVRELRAVLGEEGKHIRIISKIENHEGVSNLGEILDESDGIMVARGDLGIEIPPEQVVMVQKMAIARANRLGKPCIIATQMLESMIQKPRPTRAEVNDVANAVLDGADCVMLSGETAKGKFYQQAVEIMGKICRRAESGIDYVRKFNAIKEFVAAQDDRSAGVVIRDALASSAVSASLELNACCIVVLTRSGETVRDIARFRPRAPILAVTQNQSTARELKLYRGIFPVIVDHEMDATEATTIGMEFARHSGIAKSGSIVVLVGAEAAGESQTTSPYLKFYSA